ncbi:hypothetical protein AMTR_s00095p00177830 [Amborella trichopoda]|uniref:VQ domain-containing protein n=2 Tax=Amborella trichopoda TaxID=13333 RepID=W1NP71_AMBTC|nr:hypothetical protein AMTR_s00095p00177830 [Amborella trichopoda]
MTSDNGWTVRPLNSDSWLSNPFARDADAALTRALQCQLSQTHNADANLTRADDRFFPRAEVMSLTRVVQKEQSAATSSSTSSENEAPFSATLRRNLTSTVSGKIAKRKSRAQIKSPTTFINADPSNFRQLVQEITGIRLPYSPGNQIPGILKPEPQRPPKFQTLPSTLDSDHALMLGQAHGNVHQAHLPIMESPMFDFQAFQSFPTLESWRTL